MPENAFDAPPKRLSHAETRFGNDLVPQDASPMQAG